jgi:hypothetical protein
MAAIRVNEARKPTIRGEFISSTVGSHCESVQLMILHMH